MHIMNDSKKLFVGGIHHSTTENQLREFYSKWGEITDVVVMKDQRTGKSRGFGFVTFQELSSVDAAQSNRPHILGGKQIDSKRAMPREETNPEIHAAVKKLFVGALKKHITNEDLINYFSTYGTVVDAQVVMAKERNESRGFAFVTFDDTDVVDKIILCKPHVIGDANIDVRKALSKEEMGKVRSKPLRTEPERNWNNGNAYTQNYDNGYNQGYAAQQPIYGNFNGQYGSNFNYDTPPPTWHQPLNNNENNFGAYAQQTYGGGPMRNGPPPPAFARPAPYNPWQQH